MRTGIALLAVVCGMGVAGTHPAARAQEKESPVARTAGEDQPTGILSFQITDEAGLLVPGRLTFIGDGGPDAALFPNAAADPADLAVRKCAVYSLSGEGRITVPAGRYTVHASRGLEWSVDSAPIEIVAGREVRWRATLVHEIDTTGWVSGDFHLHTLTFSGHGDSNMPERIISLVGEGLEFAVATDHDHHTDYRPTIRRLGAASRVTAVTGNEVSTSIGHFNVFPLDPAAGVVDQTIRDANLLFALMADQASEFGIRPVIQVNHPRWGNIDYFGKAGLDPLTGTSSSAIWCDAFDSVEVLNENVGWGYVDADDPDGVYVGSGRHWVLRDWFNLLNRGHRAAAVGNSDSHHVYDALAAYPRNFVPSVTDDPGRIDPREVARAIRAHRVFTTTGPFVSWQVDGRPMGSTVTVTGRTVQVHVRVQAASWIDCDRVRIVVDGDVVDTIPVPDGRQPLRLETTVPVSIAADGWIALLVEGDDSLEPIVHARSRPVLPLAVTNPVWVDADGRAGWTSPAEQAARAVAAAGDDAAALLETIESAPPARRELLMLSAAAADRPVAVPVLRRGLRDLDRRVRLCAARAAGSSGHVDLREPLAGIVADPETGPFLSVTAMMALNALGDPGFPDRLGPVLARLTPAHVKQYARELEPLLPFRFVSAWTVAGPYRVEESTIHPLEVTYPPDRSWSSTDPVRLETDDNGYLDLLRIDEESGRAEQAVAYAGTWLHVPDDREVLYTLGTDDGCRLMVNGRLRHEDRRRHAATPLQHVGRLPLQAGWNHVVIKVENGQGGFGLYFRVLDDSVTWSEEATKR